jgi:AcrR family transcriptional regulator
MVTPSPRSAAARTRANVTDVPLQQEQRQMARRRIERAAWNVLADRGLVATVEEVAREAKVSIRTVFRHYGTRDHMIASALRAQLYHYGDSLPVPEPDASLEVWLPELLLEVHRLNAELGRAYWELASLGDTLTGELAEVAAERRIGRKRLVSAVTKGAWNLAGGQGRHPRWLVDAFAVHLSAFATRSLTADFDRTVEEVSAMSAQVLLMAVRTAADPVRLSLITPTGS